MRWCVLRWCVLCSSAVRETGVAFAGLVGVGGETGVAFAGVNGPVLGGWSRALVSWVSYVSVGARVVAHSLHARRLELPGCSRGLMNPAARGLMQR